MSEAAMEKSRGLKFAEQQLLRHGWEQGKGLGRAENGISEAIKVKVKCDKGGVGHKESEQFTFHWWDHVFNKASNSLAVESDQNGVIVKKTEDGQDGTISNKKPRKAMMSKSMLYGSFVKSATLLSGQEQPEEKLSLSEDSSSEDEEKLDLSSTKNLTDVQLMQACGGRTAHKGARHGLTMSAKLARLEQQEQEFMAKYGKKKQIDKPKPLSEEVSTKLSPAPDQERTEKNKKIKDKKKKQRSDEHKENGMQDSNEVSQGENEVISKKRKKRSKNNKEFRLEAAADSLVETNSTRKKELRTQLVLNEGTEADIAEHQPTEEGVSKKKRKKKKKKHTENSRDLVEGQSPITVACKESTESCEQEQHEEATAALPPATNACKKKKKNKKTSKDESQASEMDSCYSLDSNTAEVLEKEPPQSKKRKSREVELETENKSISQPKKKKKEAAAAAHIAVILFIILYIYIYIYIYKK